MKKEPEQKDIIKNRLHELYIKRKDILNLGPEQALNRILEEKQPFPLVHSFPEDDFYFLIHDIGLDDSLELLSMASSRQWEFILDAETWQKDRLDLNALTQWFSRLMKADPERLIQWSVQEKTGILEYYLLKSIDIIIREHDQDPSDFPNDFFTDDEVFYTRPKQMLFNPEKDNVLKKQRDEFLREFLKGLSAYDHIRYQEILLESASVLPAELEEECLRLRNVRRAEKGFLSFDEAVGIYQPVKAEEFTSHAKKSTPGKDDDVNIPTPLYSLQILEKDNLLFHALETIENSSIFQELQTEFAWLCNRVIAADQLVIRKREELRNIVKKACAYLSIGLEQLEIENPDQDLSYFIKQFPLSDIFRLGFSKALDLKWEAESWYRQSWFESKNLEPGFWDEQWLGVLGGLLIKKPLYFDNYKTGVLYKDFQSLKDIEKTQGILKHIQDVDRLFSLMDIANIKVNDRFVTWKNLILTLWARDYLEQPDKIEPVELDLFKSFYKDLWESSSFGQDLQAKKIRVNMKSLFLEWISKKTGLEVYEISEKTGEIFESLFNEIEQEYGQVSEKNLDPKYITLFLLD